MRCFFGWQWKILDWVAFFTCKFLSSKTEKMPNSSDGLGPFLSFRVIAIDFPFCIGTSPHKKSICCMHLQNGQKQGPDFLVLFKNYCSLSLIDFWGSVSVTPVFKWWLKNEPLFPSMLPWVLAFNFRSFGLFWPFFKVWANRRSLTGPLGIKIAC